MVNQSHKSNDDTESSSKTSKDESVNSSSSSRNSGTRSSSSHTFLQTCRGWVDALVIAYILAMFIRMYVVELFKIPTGSMTPTLVGDNRAIEEDYDGDGDEDLVLFYGNRMLHVFLQEEGKFVEQLWVVDPPDASKDRFNHKSRPRNDMILVNKLWYWFHPPKRGDIIVFKVPNRPELDDNPNPQIRNPWDPKKPIFIKRCVGLPEDELRLVPPRIRVVLPNDPEHLGGAPGVEWRIVADSATVNGEILSEPEIFEQIDHFPLGFLPPMIDPPTQIVNVPSGQVYMMGDNGGNSADSRAWGGVPIENIRGKAIFRYLPLRNLAFLR